MSRERTQFGRTSGPICRPSTVSSRDRWKLRWTCAIGPFQDWFRRSHQASSGPRTTSWCAATEVDFDSTLIAGDNHLIDAVLGAEDLGGTPIEPGDCLDSGGDTVNV